MSWDRFSQHERDGAGGKFPLVAASVTVGEVAGEWWLPVQAQTTPPDWVAPRTVTAPSSRPSTPACGLPVTGGSDWSLRSLTAMHCWPAGGAVSWARIKTSTSRRGR